jgi:hypothetical protein
MEVIGTSGRGKVVGKGNKRRKKIFKKLKKKKSSMTTDTVCLIQLTCMPMYCKGGHTATQKSYYASLVHSLVHLPR